MKLKVNKLVEALRKSLPNCLVNVLRYKPKVRIWISVLTDDALKPENLLNASLGVPSRFPIYLTWKSTCWKIQKGYTFDADKTIIHTVADDSNDPFGVNQVNQLNMHLSNLII